MDDKKCFQNLSALFQSHEMTHQPTRRPGHQVSTNKGWAQCLDDGDWSQKSGPSDLISGVLERVWLWAWCGYKANSRIRSLCLLFMRVSGPAARELWALLEINWICEEPGASAGGAGIMNQAVIGSHSLALTRRRAIYVEASSAAIYKDSLFSHSYVLKTDTCVYFRSVAVHIQLITELHSYPRFRHFRTNNSDNGQWTR